MGQPGYLSEAYQPNSRVKSWDDSSLNIFNIVLLNSNLENTDTNNENIYRMNT